MKKSLLILVTLFIVTIGYSQTFTDNYITYGVTSTSNNTVYASDYDASGGTVVNIPATVAYSGTTYSVTLIGSNAFKNKGLTSVTMANNITSIYPNSFRDNAITSLTLSDNVISIGSAAFINNQLTSVTLPNGLTNITLGSFANNLLTTITIPDNVTSIDQSAFAGNQLQNVTIGTSVTTIGVQAFYNNVLSSVVIPDNVTSIGTNAFTNNQLTSVVIPNNVTSIGDNAFVSNNLATVVFGNNVTTIGHAAFGSNNLTNITLPSSVTNIATIAFINNPLTSVTSLATIPPNIATGGSTDTFGNYVLRSDINLTIPTGTTSVYATDTGALWTGFKTVNGVVLGVADFELTDNLKVITTTDKIKVSFSNNIRLQNYTLYNITGIEVVKGKEREIPTTYLAKGIYILKLDFDKGTVVKKVAVN